MIRKTITLTKEAFNIYEKVKSHERSQFVSDAIIRYEKARDEDIRLEQIEKRLKDIEDRITEG